MAYGNKTIAGSFLFVGGVLYIFGANIGGKYGNDMIVNLSVVLLGLLMIASTYFIQRAFKSTLFSILIAIAGVGTVGVGLFPWGSEIYYVLAGIGYVFFGLSAIMSYKFEKSPLSYLSILLGVLAFIALVLWAFGIDLGSGVKVTPLAVDNLILPWLIGFGAHIIGDSSDKSVTSKP